MRMKIKQTFRRKKSRLISSIKYKLNFNAERCLISFTNDDALIWRLKTYMDSLNSGLCLALNALYILWFSSQPLFIFPVTESPNMKITELFDHSPRPQPDPRWLSGWSTQGPD